MSDLTDLQQSMHEQLMREAIRRTERKRTQRRAAFRRLALGVLAFIVIMVVMVMLGVGDRQTPTLRHPGVEIGTATCVVRTVSDVQPCPTN